MPPDRRFAGPSQNGICRRWLRTGTTGGVRRLRRQGSLARGRPGARRGQSSTTRRTKPVMSTLVTAMQSLRPHPAPDTAASTRRGSIGGTHASNHQRRAMITLRRSRRERTKCQPPPRRRTARAWCCGRRGRAPVLSGWKSSPWPLRAVLSPSMLLPGSGRDAGQRQRRRVRRSSPLAMRNRSPTVREGRRRLPVRPSRTRQPLAVCSECQYATVWSCPYGTVRSWHPASLPK